ncbi:MAG TPA: molybdopterin oxidoreductase family protein [Vicinamibacterales bacterium]|nr:molybdopterin oxidoreductase family protein [Vicinamibacterales bacterium]
MTVSQRTPRHVARSSTVRTHCPYCALQCGLLVTRSADATIAIAGDPDFPVNAGALCVKGYTAGETLAHPDRLRSPLVRDRGGQLRAAGWDEAFDRIAAGIRVLQRKYGRDAIGIFGGGSLTNEKVYLLGKFARAVLRTPHIDYNGRFCMSSAAAAGLRAFGLDRGLPFPVSDIALADAILLVGANVAETMPPIMQYFDAQRRAGGKLIVVDPRQTATAAQATLHLRLVPGSDAILAHGLLHVLIHERLIDEAYIRERTEGFEAVRAHSATYWPERVERLTGVPQRDIIETARTLGTATNAIVLTARGAEQHSQGVANVLSFINLALAMGRVGRPYNGYGCLTGQGNGQGGREHGQKADQLPGYQKLDDAPARERIAALWGVAPEDLPGPGRSAYELLDTLGRDGGVRGLLVMGSNPVVSAPHAAHVEERLGSLDLLVVCDFFLSETARLADIVLPSAQWAEEDGTMTNLEGRVLRRRRVVDPPDGVRTDLQILNGLAGALGSTLTFPVSARTALRELRAATAGAPADYSAVSHARIDRDDGVFWPCSDAAPEGTPRLFADRFYTPSGRARFHRIYTLGPAERPDAEYPFYLTTGRVLAQYQSGTQTRRVERLRRAAREPEAEIHPRAAQRSGLTDGGHVTIETRRGRASFRVKTTGGIREDTIFVAFHWPGDQSANRLTNTALDPISRMPEFKVCAARIAAPARRS